MVLTNKNERSNEPLGRVGYGFGRRWGLSGFGDVVSARPWTNAAMEQPQSPKKMFRK